MWYVVRTQLCAIPYISKVLSSTNYLHDLNWSPFHVLGGGRMGGRWGDLQDLLAVVCNYSQSKIFVACTPNFMYILVYSYFLFCMQGSTCSASPDAKNLTPYKEIVLLRVILECSPQGFLIPDILEIVTLSTMMVLLLVNYCSLLYSHVWNANTAVIINPCI